MITGLKMYKKYCYIDRKAKQIFTIYFVKKGICNN